MLLFTPSLTPANGADAQDSTPRQRRNAQMAAFNQRPDKGTFDLEALQAHPERELRRYLAAYWDELGIDTSQVVLSGLPPAEAWKSQEPIGPQDYIVIHTVRRYHGIAVTESGGMLRVHVHPITGKVMRVMNTWIPIPSSFPTAPAIDSAQAVAIALEQLQGRETHVKASLLRCMFRASDGGETPRMLWVVELHVLSAGAGRAPNVHRGVFRVYVDAVSQEAVSVLDMGRHYTVPSSSYDQDDSLLVNPTPSNAE